MGRQLRGGISVSGRSVYPGKAVRCGSVSTAPRVRRTCCDVEAVFCPMLASTTTVYVPAGTGSPVRRRAGQGRVTWPFHTDQSTRKLPLSPPPRVTTPARCVTPQPNPPPPPPPPNPPPSTP